MPMIRGERCWNVPESIGEVNDAPSCGYLAFEIGKCYGGHC